MCLAFRFVKRAVRMEFFKELLETKGIEADAEQVGTVDVYTSRPLNTVSFARSSSLWMYPCGL